MQDQVLENFLAQRLLQSEYTDERALFLKELVHSARLGHLCIEKPFCPLPASLVQANGPIVQHGNRFYLQRNWVYETVIVEKIKKLQTISPLNRYDSEIFAQELEKQSLNESQFQAVQSAFGQTFALICGGPGTGKTYTASVLVKLLFQATKRKKYKVILTAPTGKAASHLQAMVQMPVDAMTLHRLLHVKPGEINLFSGKYIDADLVIVDEASMLDVPLMAQLFDAIGEDTRLIFMGDPDQLPPVETGSLFGEIAHCLGRPLQMPMRTNVPELQRLAQIVKQGEMPAGHWFLNWSFDASFPKRLFDLLPTFDANDPKVCLRQMNKFRILSALRQGPFGIEALNQQLLGLMKLHVKPGKRWVIPIMIQSNDARADLYNGDCGVLIGDDPEMRSGMAYFDHKCVHSYELPNYGVAFCLSIHKSQGIEFDEVLVLLPPGSENFGKEALYTAVTRAKEKVSIVGNTAIVQQMLAKSFKLKSGFRERFV